jgi:hypothetical protein
MMGKKQKLKIDLKMMDAYTEALETELELAYDDNEDINRRLGIANSTVYKLQQHIENQNKIITQYENAIERKDRQFEGLKAAYKDDLINSRLG